MNKPHLHGVEFISSVFKPTVVVSSSTDAELLCVKNHLTFTDLLKPFSSLNKDVILRDQNNLSHTIKNLKINFEDISSTPLTPNQVKKLLSHVVSSCHSAGLSTYNIKYEGTEITVPTSTPWFDLWRQVLIENMTFSEHEFLNHYLACVFVVSTFNNDVMDQFQRLAQQMTSAQTSGTNSSRFFNGNILKYYVLLHDQGQGDQNKAEELFKMLRTSYGTNNCYLLAINSVSTKQIPVENITNSNINNNMDAGSSTEKEAQPDPWIQFLTPGGTVSDILMTDQPNNPSNAGYDGNDIALFKAFNDDPLAGFKSYLDDKDGDLLGSHNNKGGSGGVKYSTSFPQLAVGGSSTTRLLNSDRLLSSANDSSEIIKIKSDINKPHGQCLTPNDHERIREFVYEFVSFSLIPWVEATLKQLSDQIAYKMKVTRGLFNVTKKLFSGVSASSTKSVVTPTSLSSHLSGSASNISNNTTTAATKVVYTTEAIEMQMRRHADLAFLFQQYEVAYQTYNVLKKDFQDDAAWLHYAGVMEMCTLATFLQGSASQRQYQVHFMDSAIGIYLTHCRNMEYATRAVLLNCEALKSQGLFLQASSQLVKLTTEDNDLRSALLLEQAAHFYLKNKHSMLRKYAFHLILAGYRFGKTGQKKHTIRCYTQALPVFRDRNWTLAEDHIYASISKYAYLQKQLDTALNALQQLLSSKSRQPPSAQTMYLKDFLKIFKEYSDCKNASSEKKMNKSLSEFPVPILDSQSVKVTFGQPNKQYDELSVEARDIPLSSNDCKDQDWQDLELSILESINGGSKSKPSNRLTKFNAKAQVPMSIIDEAITVQMFLENPLNIPIVLTELCLLWEFSPSNSSNSFSTDLTDIGDNNNNNMSMLTNEFENNTKPVKEFVVSEIYSEFCLLQKEKKTLQLSVIPKMLGRLKIVGIAFYLNSSSPNQVTKPYSQLNDYQTDGETTDSSLIRLKGKLLFGKGSSKIESANLINFEICPSMPKLKVVFSEFPSSVIIDEVCRISLVVSNIGKESMTNVFLSVKPHDLITFGFDEFSSSITNQIYQFRDPPNTDCHEDDLLNSDIRKICSGFCRKLILGKDNCLRPGESLTIPMWIRFHNVSSETKDVKFLFYYESVNEHPNLKYRLLRHRSEIHLKSTLSFHGQIMRPKGIDNLNYILNLKIENQHHPVDNAVMEFDVYQITSVSRSLQLSKSFSNNDVVKSITIGPKEIYSVCLKLEQISKAIGESAKNSVSKYFVNILLDSETKMVHSAGSPCSDFFYLNYFQNDKDKDDSQQHNTHTSLNCPLLSNLDDISFIILWKAKLKHSNDTTSFHFGQSHIFTSKIDYSSIKSENNDIKQSHIKSLFDSSRPLSSSDFSLQPIILYSKLVNISLLFDQIISCDFTKTKKLVVPVQFGIHNASSEHIVVRIEPHDSQSPADGHLSVADKLSPPADLQKPVNPFASDHHKFLMKPPADLCTTVQWIGINSRQFPMGPNESRRLQLKCLVARPGVYEVHCLTVKAAVVGAAGTTRSITELAFIKQDNAFSSILIVTQQQQQQQQLATESLSV